MKKAFYRDSDSKFLAKESDGAIIRTTVIYLSDGWVDIDRRLEKVSLINDTFEEELQSIKQQMREDSGMVEITAAEFNAAYQKADEIIQKSF
ncbi:MAG: hypothetical protein AB7U05_09185 [Mangrovibacterium sp.]